MKRRDQNSLVIAQVLELATCLFEDLSSHHPHLKTSIQTDLRTLKNRVRAEGIGFVTHALPSYGKAILRSLETTTLVAPMGFKPSKGTVLPRFLGGLLTGVYDKDGKLRTNTDDPCLTDLLQVCFMFYKVDLPYAQKFRDKVIEAFKATEVDLKQLVLPKDDEVLTEARNIITRVFKGFDPMNIYPQHGPGAVATGEKGQNKWVIKRKFLAIHRVYPYYAYFVASRPSLLGNLSDYKALMACESGVAKVTLVPKDSRGPRLISMEPLEYQYIQQGLARAIVKHLEEKNPYTRGFVNFTDQNVNRDLAKFNSVTRRYSTLDMKEASDRVSTALVKELFQETGPLINCLLGTRTTHTELPSGEVLELSKFAPMGSALCFPVEAVIFWALAEATRRLLRIPGRVYVYGDDIIVPRELTPVLFDKFPKYGLMFNEGKCFTNGYFRESCGFDAFKGNLCTPVRFRRQLPTNLKDAKGIVSAVSLANYLYERGYWRAAHYVESAVNALVSVDIVRGVKVNFGGLSYSSFTSKGVITGNRSSVRWNKSTQAFEVNAWLPKEKTMKNRRLPERAAMLRNLLGKQDAINVVPSATKILRRWYPLYS